MSDEVTTPVRWPLFVCGRPPWTGSDYESAVKCMWQPFSQIDAIAEGEVRRHLIHSHGIVSDRRSTLEMASQNDLERHRCSESRERCECHDCTQARHSALVGTGVSYYTKNQA